MLLIAAFLFLRYNHEISISSLNDTRKRNVRSHLLATTYHSLYPDSNLYIIPAFAFNTTGSFKVDNDYDDDDDDESVLEIWDKNSYTIYTFTGVGFRLYGNKKSGRGTFSLELDGVQIATVSCADTSSRKDVLLYESPIKLEFTTHTIKVTLLQDSSIKLTKFLVCLYPGIKYTTAKSLPIPGMKTQHKFYDENTVLVSSASGVGLSLDFSLMHLAFINSSSKINVNIDGCSSFLVLTRASNKLTFVTASSGLEIYPFGKHSINIYVAEGTFQFDGILYLPEHAYTKIDIDNSIVDGATSSGDIWEFGNSAKLSFKYFGTHFKVYGTITTASFTTTIVRNGNSKTFTINLITNITFKNALLIDSKDIDLGIDQCADQNIQISFSQNMKICHVEYLEPCERPTSSFSHSFEFTGSKHFTSSQSFTRSTIFTKSNEFSRSSTFSQSNTFTFSQVFTESAKFSKSNEFTNSNAFDPSNAFTKSNSFSVSNIFTPSIGFTKSQIFDQTRVFTSSDSFVASEFFTSSHEFTQSSSFSKSDHFTESSIFTSSEEFSNSKSFSFSLIFTESSKFTQSNSFSPSGRFSQSDGFTSSNPFPGTDTFTSSNVFSHSLTFSKTQSFSHSSQFSRSAYFTSSEQFSSSLKFSASHIFSATAPYSSSISFTLSSHFSDSAFFTASDHFSSSKAFSPSRQFTPTTKFTESSLFTQSTEFTTSEVFSDSYPFTPSEKHTRKFTTSDLFTNSLEFSESSSFSPSKVFTFSDPFTPTRKFNNGVGSIGKKSSIVPMVIGILAAIIAIIACVICIIIVILKKRKRQEVDEEEDFENDIEMLNVKNTRSPNPVGIFGASPIAKLKDLGDVDLSYSYTYVEEEEEDIE